MISINIFLERDNKAMQKSIEKKNMLKKNGTHEGPKRIEKNDEHMKAHEKKLAMSQNKKLEKEIISNRGV